MKRKLFKKFSQSCNILDRRRQKISRTINTNQDAAIQFLFLFWPNVLQLHSCYYRHFRDNPKTDIEICIQVFMVFHTFQIIKLSSWTDKKDDFGLENKYKAAARIECPLLNSLLETLLNSLMWQWIRQWIQQTATKLRK